MCGILTIYKKEGLSKQDVSSALDALALIKHRGPDGEGLILINSINQTFEIVSTQDTPIGIPGKKIDEIDFNTTYNLLLGHRRLSIIDLSIKGHQPFFYDNLVTVFNGEIYNFIELRETLIKENYIFNSGTDTEVILAAYRHWGTDCFSKFNGMWSIVIYDFNSGEVVVSNDRFGVKPLYYYQQESEFILMSETKQILAFPNKMQGVNNNVVEVFMDLGYLFYNDETFFKGVNRFPNASFYKFYLNNDKIELANGPQKFYKTPTVVNKKITKQEAIQQFKELLTDAVRIRLRSDVEWGISLSGGMDSTSIAFVAKDILGSNNFTTFSVIAKKGTPEDESHFIDIANEKLKSKNIQINPLNNFDRETFVSQIYQIGSPVGSTSFFAQYMIKRAIKENGVTVLLSGQGGDEILAGYHHHFYKYITELLSKGKFKRALSEIKKWTELKGYNLPYVLKAALADFYLAKKTRLGLSRFAYKFQKDIFQTDKLIDYLKLDLSMLQLPYFLQADDSFSMAYAVETRNPFLDYRLVDFAFQLPDEFKINEGWQKWILREAISELPDEIRYRKDKKGFSTPMHDWVDKNTDMLNELAALSDKMFPQYQSKPLFKRAAFGAWIENFLNKK